MVVSHFTLEFSTRGFCDFKDVTPDVKQCLKESGVTDGLMTVMVTGSTGAITTIEYESGALKDLQDALERLAPTDMEYAHNLRWRDGNGFSHVRAALMKPSLSIPVKDGKPCLGTWQQVVLIDFDNRPRQRTLVVQIIGNSDGSPA